MQTRASNPVERLSNRAEIADRARVIDGAQYPGLAIKAAEIIGVADARLIVLIRLLHIDDLYFINGHVEDAAGG